MKILVVGDCHGVKPGVGQEAEEADLILATGDICGDPGEVREAMFRSMEENEDWWSILGRDDAKEKVRSSLEDGRKVLEYLDSFDKPVFLVPGNWDWIGEEPWEFLSENRFQKLVDEFKNIHNIDREMMSDGSYSYIGYGPCSAPEIPQYEDDMPESEEELEKMKEEYVETGETLEKLFRKAENPVIFLSHNVPHDTSLDRIENPDSPVDGRHYGSIIVKDLIEEFEPVLSLAGHIHEGYGREDIAGTVAVNAGLESHVMIEIENGEVKGMDFHPETEG
ncbi:MAG: metallophosphoesterase [Candidatus Nanosalina sp.]